MPSMDSDSRRVEAVNRGDGLQPLHQGNGNLGVNTGDNSVQNNIATQNVFNVDKIDLETLLRLMQVFNSGREITLTEATRGDVLIWLHIMLQSSVNFQVLDHHVHQQALFRTLVPETGTWVFNTRQFEQWKDGPSNLLWMNGSLGSGKTMLTSLIIDHLEKEAQGKNMGCVYVYFRGEQEKEPSLAYILLTLLKQLLQQQQSEEVCQELKTTYSVWHKYKVNPSLDEYLQLFKTISSAFETVYVVIDALDDCEGCEGEEFRLKFQEIVQSLRWHCKILITSRNGWDTGRELKPNEVLQVVPRDDDIKLYIRSRINDNEVLRREMGKSSQPSFLEKVIDKVAQATKGIFLMTKLHMDYLEQQKTLGAINLALSELPDSVTKAFETSILQIKKKSQAQKLTSKQGLAEHVLTWITNSVTPINADQVCLSFALHNSKAVLDKAFVPDKDDLMFVCAGLVTIDPKTEVLRLVHESVQKHLVNHGIIKEEAHMDMAKSCLRCLLLDETDEKLEEPLFKYCAKHWITHLRQGRSKEDDVEIEALTMRFLSESEKVSRAFKAMAESRSMQFRGMTGLHAAVYFIEQDWAEKLIESGVDLDSPCCDGQTALHWAVKYGRRTLVTFLLEKGANVDERDKSGDAPLHVALMGSTTYSEPIVKELLKANAQVETKGRRGVKPLLWAMKYASSEIAEMMVMNIADPNAEDGDGWTSLRDAMDQAKSDIVRQLLKRGADPNRASAKGDWNPLKAAVQNGHEELSRILLENEADPNLHDELGASPLRWAIYYSRVEIIRLLLSYNPNLQDRDSDGMTPLLAATMGKQSTIVWMLLEHGARPDELDREGNSSLHYAIHNQDSSIAWLLVKKGASLTIRDSYGLTPLDAAIEKNDLPLVFLLCEHGAPTETTDEDKLSPLHRASAHGHDGIVRYLVMKGVNKDLVDVKDRTAMHHAVVCDRKETVALLASSGANINQKDASGSTALHLAVAQKNLGMLRVLLEHGASCDVRDKDGLTVLHRAAIAKFNDGLAVLVKATSSPDLGDEQMGFTAVHHAVWCGDRDTVLVLINGGVNTNVRDHHGRTPLALAKELKKGIDMNRLFI